MTKVKAAKSNNESDVKKKKDARVKELVQMLNLEVESLEDLSKRLGNKAVICWQGSSINAAT